MNTKKMILYILLAALFLTVFYNVIIAPNYYQSYSQTRMHMGMGMRNNSQYYIDFTPILLIFASAFFFFIFAAFAFTSSGNICSGCNTKLESVKWRICPVCGRKITNGKGDVR